MIHLDKWPYLRKDELEDLYANADQSYCLVRLPVPLPLSSTRNYMRAVRTESTNGRPFLCFAVYLDDRIIGKIEASKDEEDNAEADLILKRQYTGKGYGTEAMRQLQMILQERQWCRTLAAYTDRDNAAMIRVLEKNGFEKERDFTADVMIPDGGTYTVKSVRGMEYVYYFFPRKMVK